MFNFDFPEIVNCACCKKTFQIDMVLCPFNPKHPYYKKWVCEDCFDKIEAQKRIQKAMQDFGDKKC